MTDPTKVVWEEWETKPVTVLMARFTGFDHGNGWALLQDLRERGVSCDRDPDKPERMRINTRERGEATVRLADYIVIGTRSEVYPIEPQVQHDKYQRPTVRVES